MKEMHTAAGRLGPRGAARCVAKASPCRLAAGAHRRGLNVARRSSACLSPTTCQSAIARSWGGQRRWPQLLSPDKRLRAASPVCHFSAALTFNLPPLSLPSAVPHCPSAHMGCHPAAGEQPRFPEAAAAPACLPTTAVAAPQRKPGRLGQSCSTHASSLQHQPACSPHARPMCHILTTTGAGGRGA